MDMTNEDRIILRYGIANPYWEMSKDSAALKIYTCKGGALLDSIPLKTEQFVKIKLMTGVTECLVIRVLIDMEDIDIMLIGRKSDVSIWSGLMADTANAAVVAKELGKGLSFAEQLVSEVNAFVVVLDQQGKICRFNKVAEEWTGYPEDQLVGVNAHDLFMDEDARNASRKNIEGFFQKKTSYEVLREIKLLKGKRTLHFRNKLIKDWQDGALYLVCTGIDVTDELLANQKLERLANIDELTGLNNRHRIMAIVNEYIKRNDPFSVLFIDLDNFKKINDCYGHGYGDDLLKHIANVLTNILPKEGTVGRLGGDEFLAILPVDEVEPYLKRVYFAISKAVKIGFAEIYTNCSVGIANFPEHATDIESLIRYADTAMYAAKENGKHCFAYFESNMNKKVEDYLWLDQNLRQAIQLGQISINYQPKQNLVDETLYGMEALIRWNHPEKGFISPLSFIPFAEESGIIASLGKYVMIQAAQQLAKLRREFGYQGSIAVNLSPRQLCNRVILHDYKEACTLAGVELGALDLEITESCFIDDSGLAVEIIKEFQSFGVKILMDDFGTGFSSLSQLTKLPIDIIKIDRSFIKDFESVEKSANKSVALIKTMVAVAEQLGMQTVAEGVETIEQKNFLKSIGVDIIQGYLYAKPMASEQLDVWMQKLNDATVIPFVQRTA